MPEEIFRNGEMNEEDEKRMGDEKQVNNFDEQTQGEVPGAIDPQAFVGDDTALDDTTLDDIALNEAMEKLQMELEETRAKADEYLDGWQRSRAEFSNYKKRIEREQAHIYQTTAGNLIKHFLEIADDLERALNSRPQEKDGEQWANGVELIYRKLMATIEAEGVIRIEPDGQYFDPTFHEAISQEDSKQHESGQIIEVLQPGYQLGDRVLRPARVRVAR
jgi:molecular chaperone GrpE